MFYDQRVDFNGFNGTEIRFNKPDVCIIDNTNGRAFIVEVANPFDHFIEMCYQQKFEKCYAFVFGFKFNGFPYQITVIIIGSLGVVYIKFIIFYQASISYFGSHKTPG